MSTHDPLKFATTLSAKLAARSRHVCVFLGAGTSRACGLPDVAQLQSQVLTGLGKVERGLFEQQLKGRNLEQALSRLRRIQALLTDGQSLDGLTAKSANSLDAAVCQEIIARLDVTKADLLPVKRFAAWVARAHYQLPVEIFTVNYDLLLETALEELRITFFDGFVGVVHAQFQTELVEASPAIGRDWLPADFVRLWKLHGSVNWKWEDQTVVRLGQPVSKEVVAAIYPSDTKYEESRRVPFVVLQDRFRRALHSPETILLVSAMRSVTTTSTR